MNRTSCRQIAIIFLALAIILVPCSFAIAAQIRLAWDSNTEPDLEGYKIYYGTAPRVYTTSVNAGNVTAYTLTGLSQGQTYYIAATAYDTYFIESAYSNEVSGIATDPGQTVTVTLTANPPGLQVTVDGSSYTAPQPFTWTAGSSHTLSISSPQNGATGTRYVYASWSDGGSQSHSITVPSSGTTYTANFTTQYTLATQVNPPGSGSVSPSGTNWYNSNQSVVVTAAPGTGYSFSSWTGDLTGSTNPASITINGPRSVAANFLVTPGALSVTPGNGLTASGNQGGPFSPSSQVYTLQNTGGSAFDWNASRGQNWLSLSSTGGSLAPGASATVTVSMNSNANSLGPGTYHDTVTFNNLTTGSGNTTRSVILSVSGPTLTYRVATDPSGLGIIVDGVTYKAPKKFTWTVGSSHTLSLSSPQNGPAGKRYVFSSWSDGGAQEHILVAPSSSTTYTASFSVQYSLTASANINGAGSVDTPEVNWYDKGQMVTLSATPSFDYGFQSWSSGSGSVIGRSNPISITMNKPRKLKANFRQNRYSVKLSIDPVRSGVVTLSPAKPSYAYGEQITLTAKPTAGYVFTKWDGNVNGTENPVTITVTCNMTIGAVFFEMDRAPQPPEGEGLPLIGKLESPSNGKNASGIKPIYGWTLDGEGISKVELFVDGTYVCKIPYGGIREDVRQSNPTYPNADQSGFAMVWNYAGMTPGDHTVLVRVSSIQGESLDLIARVTAVKFHGEFVTGMTPEFLVPGTITVTADGVTKTYDVNIEWSNESQDFGIADIIPRE